MYWNIRYMEGYIGILIKLFKEYNYLIYVNIVLYNCINVLILKNVRRYI